MDSEKKKLLIRNVLLFLQDEVRAKTLNDEKRESVEVAIQCLETAFDLNSEETEALSESERVDLLAFMPNNSDSDKVLAEEYKNNGNTQIRSGNYAQAVDEYTKAINLNPTNAVYYCNRAAAFSRMNNHRQSVLDCKRAIQLSSSYSKAYSRLGIAYFNMGKIAEAREAYMMALTHDPNNPDYLANLKLADEKLEEDMGVNSTSTEQFGPQFQELINNTDFLNMAGRMMNDPSIRNMIANCLPQGVPNSMPGNMSPETYEFLRRGMDIMRNNLRTQQNEAGAGCEETPPTTETTPDPTEKN